MWVRNILYKLSMLLCSYICAIADKAFPRNVALSLRQEHRPSWALRQEQRSNGCDDNSDLMCIRKIQTTDKDSNHTHQSFHEEDITPPVDEHGVRPPCRDFPLKMSRFHNTTRLTELGWHTYDRAAAKRPPNELANELEAMKMLIRKTNSVFL